MAGQVTIERRESGELVARKRPTGPADVALLRREAAVLDHVQGDGVVELLAVLPDGLVGEGPLSAGLVLGPVLELGYLGASLDATAPPDAPSAVRLVAQAAAALAGAHAAGISHGQVVAGHVLRDARGAAVVCSWGAAGARSDVAGLAELPGPAFEPGADVAQLGALLAELLEGTGTPSHHGRGPGRARADQRLRTKAGAVAAAARHPDPDLRPSMADLAQRLADMVPAATPADAAAPADPAATAGRATGLTSFLDAVTRLFSAPGRARPKPSQLVVVGRAAARGAGGTLAGVAPFDGGPPKPAAASSPSAAAAPPTAIDPAPEATDGPPGVPSAVAPATATAPTPTCPTTPEDLAFAGLPAACGDELRVSGREILLGDARYVLGEDGDQVVLADLRCDGHVRPTLLRPGSGDVYTFDAWATSGADASGRLLGHVPGATGIEADGAGGCGKIVVLAGDGARIPLHGEELR